MMLMFMTQTYCSFRAAVRLIHVLCPFVIRIIQYIIMIIQFVHNIKILNFCEADLLAPSHFTVQVIHKTDRGPFLSCVISRNIVPWHVMQMLLRPISNKQYDALMQYDAFRILPFSMVTHECNHLKCDNIFPNVPSF